MTVIGRCFYGLRFNLGYSVRYSNTIVYSAAYNTFLINPKFTRQDQEKILSVLNESNKQQLESLRISEANLKKIESYKNKNGPFRSLNDLLNIHGFGTKLLDKLCEKIISENPSSLKKTNGNSNNKRLKQFLVPLLPPDKKITSSVGIYLSLTGVSWVKLSNDTNEVSDWSFQDFESLPKKMLPIDTFNLAMSILKLIPVGDVYVFEGHSHMGLQGQKPPSSIAPYTQNLELIAMLLALINTSPTHNSIFDLDNGINNKVYFLRSKLFARLFKTLVGNECVSSNATVSQLIDKSKETFSLPCTSINVNDELRNHYLSQSSAHKDLLGQALLLSVAFADLCIRANPVSLNAVTPGKKALG